MEDIQLTLTHDTVASTAREVCRSALNRWELPDRVDDVLLVVAELVHNVRRHTDDGGHLRLSAHEDAILVEVIDSDPRPPHLKPLDPTMYYGWRRGPTTKPGSEPAPGPL
jgi:anti-sigma regulatory factor (Ser/Thr protein kinase)